MSCLEKAQVHSGSLYKMLCFLLTFLEFGVLFCFCSAPKYLLHLEFVLMHNMRCVYSCDIVFSVRRSTAQSLGVTMSL